MASAAPSWSEESAVSYFQVSTFAFWRNEGQEGQRTDDNVSAGRVTGQDIRVIEAADDDARVRVRLANTVGLFWCTNEEAE